MQSILQENAQVLPADFDGVFRFTNFTDEDFVTLWDKVEYTFPAKSTVPLIIPGETLEGIQSIRRKFAKRLAIREFYAGKRYDELNNLTAKSGVPPLIDEDKELAPLIQKCLEPLPVSRASMKKTPKSETHVSEYTKVISDKESLKAGSTDAVGQLEGLPTE